MSPPMLMVIIGSSYAGKSHYALNYINTNFKEKKVYVLNDYGREYDKLGFQNISWDQNFDDLEECVLLIEDFCKPDQATLKAYSKLILYSAHHRGVNTITICHSMIGMGLRGFLQFYNIIVFARSPSVYLSFNIVSRCYGLSETAHEKGLEFLREGSSGRGYLIYSTITKMLEGQNGDFSLEFTTTSKEEEKGSPHGTFSTQVTKTPSFSLVDLVLPLNNKIATSLAKLISRKIPDRYAQNDFFFKLSSLKRTISISLVDLIAIIVTHDEKPSLEMKIGFKHLLKKIRLPKTYVKNKWLRRYIF